MLERPVIDNYKEWCSTVEDSWRSSTECHHYDVLLNVFLFHSPFYLPTKEGCISDVVPGELILAKFFIGFNLMLFHLITLLVI